MMPTNIKSLLRQNRPLVQLKRFVFQVLGIRPHMENLLRRELAKLPNREWVIVQVGSNDGQTGDPLFQIIANNPACTAIFVEPVNYLLEKARKNHPNRANFVYVNKAIAADEAVMTFYHVSGDAIREIPDLPEWHDQLGSFDKNHIARFLGDKIIPYIVEKPVQTVPLSKLFRDLGLSKVDCLHIDTEGYDLKVLKTLDFEYAAPSIILFEHKHLKQSEQEEAKTLLIDQGYHCTTWDGDTIATKIQLTANS